jgi:large subunit ribosomal protein L5
MSRLRDKYRQEVVPALREEFGYGNPHQVPRLEKVVVNVGIGEAVRTPDLLDAAVKEVTAITGQRPVVTRARKSISNFRLREGMAIGCKVTLRGERMYEFLDRLMNASLPRIRDFRGVSSRAFDGRGNYTLGLKDQMLFPEIHYDDVVSQHGLDVCIVSTAETDEEARALLRHLGMPFRQQ